MTDEKENISRIPVVLLHPVSSAAYSIFNSNDWQGLSKSIITSCAAQYGLLQFSASQLCLLYKNAEQLCRSRVAELSKQYSTSAWPLDKCDYHIEVPEVHLQIQFFLSTVKTFLDLIVQLIHSENIVNKKIHGFHKKGNVVGGEIQHFLEAKAINKNIAHKLHGIISTHKQSWMDEVVNIRDVLVHPEKGLVQVMFRVQITLKEKKLKLKIIMPSVSEKSFDHYATSLLKSVEAFSKVFISTIKTA